MIDLHGYSLKVAKQNLESYILKSYENNFRNIINHGIASGELTNLNSEVILFSILSTLRNLYMWIPKKDDVNPTEISISLSHILIQGIIINNK